MIKHDVKLFWILFGASLAAVVLVFPYAFTLQSEIIAQAPLSWPVLAVISLAQSGVMFAIAVFLGIKLNRKNGFNFPFLDTWLKGEKIEYKKTFVLAAVLGLGAGIAIVILNTFLFNTVEITAKPEIWKGFLGSFYGAIAEEILLRLFFMSLIIFILNNLFRRKNNSAVIIWFAIIFASVVFGLGHLPITSALTEINIIVIVRAIVLNGIGGIIFGWLYWKKGLTAAIVSHFFADQVLLVIVPFLF